ncbi:integrase core domain protein [Gregarina niphandrodes]|uniref:Integrase core domain protein n=1 Tax=Gregarina niphandrodes TaxID=110365 RepID=A0A023B9B3_GRENI|nr:integrase core domain protein [Gregarina niphandrodes]EZG72699.1 integrase core domain protein [Gregarina niphandrodes]|eukprot:XP_011129757.1 integrase core domain protein [Gregarina niphandrodes]
MASFLDRVSLDLIGPRMFKGNTHYILVIIDAATRFLVTRVIQSKEAQVITDAFAQGFVAYFGVPRQVYVDNGSEFEGAFAAFVTKVLRVDIVKSPPYVSRSNGTNVRAKEQRHKRKQSQSPMHKPLQYVPPLSDLAHDLVLCLKVVTMACSLRHHDGDQSDDLTGAVPELLPRMLPRRIEVVREAFVDSVETTL